MARSQSGRGGNDHGTGGAHRSETLPGAVRAGGRGTVPGGAAAADVRSLEGWRRAGSSAPAARRVGGGGPLRLLLDSVILIDHFNGRPEATRYLASIAGEAALSVITRAEVLTGFDAEE